MITNSINKLSFTLIWKAQMNVTHPGLYPMQLVVWGLDQKNSEKCFKFSSRKKIL